jgi:hypothetical protein
MHRATRLPISISPQPDDVTCGPTCLQSVYRYFGEEVPLEELIATVPTLPAEAGGRGTLAVMLGCHALRRGYHAQLHSLNLNVFDPTWFPRDASRPGDPDVLREKLRLQAAVKAPTDAKLGVATIWYLEFLDRGGEICLGEMSSRLIGRWLTQGQPILTGLSSTYLYHHIREYGPNDDDDDIRGVPQGHFVVLIGHDHARRTVLVADPLGDRSTFGTHVYEVSMARLVGAIMLGVLTYDGNLLIIHPKSPGDAAEGKARSR